MLSNYGWIICEKQGFYADYEIEDNITSKRFIIKTLAIKVEELFNKQVQLYSPKNTIDAICDGILLKYKDNYGYIIKLLLEKQDEKMEIGFRY